VIVKPGHGDVRGEVFKHAESGVTVNRKTSGTGAVDSHVVGKRKFAAGQQDRAGDADSVIVSPSFATASVSRNEPGPLSLVFVTRMMLAGAVVLSLIDP